MKNLFLSAAAIFGAIPGVTVLLSGIGVPAGYRSLFGGVIEFTGVLTLLLLFLNSARLTRISKKRLTRWSLGMSGGCVASLVASLFLVMHCVVMPTKAEYREYGPVFFPLWTSGRIAERITTTGSRQAVLDTFGPTPVVQDLARMPRIALAHWVTLALMLFVNQATFTTLTVAFGLPGLAIQRLDLNP